MRKCILTLCILIGLLTGCNPIHQQTIDSEEVMTSFPDIIEPHNPEQAEQSGDVVVLMNGMRNGDKWRIFMKHVSKEQPNQVRVTQYTIEGGPVIHELVYDGKVIQTTYDDSRDMYGSGQGETTNTCKGIGTIKSEQGRTFYVLTDCEKENIFSLPK
ncbi:DUF4362 domain-containing protein [Paenibacillus sp. FSL R5-0749]|uniref:DUF4362 domain-containing protein n=1 Tax=Paenibacillus sp. FSL R5-0749 TaxID=2921657 RepID=UPI00315B2C65